ncbi:TPA: hypothetical protein I8Z67_001952 [Legionella pneumophila]|nr:hypothetical protein [Legionella pneumophila]HAT1926509.1 hypothetical protein [Legionella pneumophila]
MSNKGKQNIEPKLRFPMFRNSHGWEEKRVGEIFKVTRGEVLSMVLVNNVKTSQTPYPVYSSQTKNNGLSGFYSDYLYENAITWTTDGANAGDVNYRAGKFYCTNVCGVLLNSEGYANTFVAAMLNNITKKHVSYVGNPKLMNGVMSKIIMPLPTLEEQQKIADCLSSINELITAESKKFDALNTFKKGLMQQLFPAEGETLPKLRFSEFQNNSEWEEKTLSKLCTLQAGKFIEASEIYKENKQDLYPCYGGNGLRGFVKSYTHTGTYPLIGRQGALCGNINIGRESFYATEHAIVVTAKQKVNVTWLFYQLIRLNLNQYATGQAQPGLSVTVLDKVYSTIPRNLIEQQKIAACLSSIDELITVQSKKIELLKNHKKGLMQQLFPTMSEL